MLPSLQSGSVREGQGQTLGLGDQGLFLGDTDKGKVGESKGLQSKAVLITYLLHQGKALQTENLSPHELGFDVDPERAGLGHALERVQGTLRGVGCTSFHDVS